jgi:ankyrin repeat protein
VQSASIENTYGDTALMLAQKNKNDAVIALLSSFNIVV